MCQHLEALAEADQGLVGIEHLLVRLEARYVIVSDSNVSRRRESHARPDA
jgi:hypothetical protein